MTYQLDKADLINLILGFGKPHDDLVAFEPFITAGSFDEDFVGDVFWCWSKTELEKLSEEVLWEMYSKMKALGHE